MKLLIILLILAIPPSGHSADIQIGEIHYGDERVVTEIREVPEGEDIHLYIDSPGGNLHTAQMILKEMGLGKHKFIAHVIGALSAAFLITVSSDEIVCVDNPFVMAHLVSVALPEGRMTANVATGISEYLTHVNKFTMDIIKDFLEPDEIDMVINDIDVYMRCEELKSRNEKDFVLMLVPNKIHKVQ